MTTNERYEAILTADAQRDGVRIAGFKSRIAKALDTLKTRPERGHPLRGALSGCRSLVVSRSLGGYQAVYIVRDEIHRCYVFAIGPHATVYELAASRYAALGEEP